MQSSMTRKGGGRGVPASAPAVDSASGGDRHGMVRPAHDLDEQRSIFNLDRDRRCRRHDRVQHAQPAVLCVQMNGHAHMSTSGAWPGSRAWED